MWSSWVADLGKDELELIQQTLKLFRFVFLTRFEIALHGFIRLICDAGAIQTIQRVETPMAQEPPLSHLEPPGLQVHIVYI